MSRSPRLSRRLTSAIAMAALLVGGLLPAAAAAEPTGGAAATPSVHGRVTAVPGGPVDGQLIAAAARAGRLVVTTEDGRHLTREVGSSKAARAAVTELLSNPAVTAVEADQVVSVQTVLDPLASRQWELGRIGADVTQAAGADGDGVTIAILDTGVKRDHVDLKANVVGGYDAITRTAAASIPDENGHGTLAAGSAAMVANNLGGRGIAHAASIMPVKVLEDNGNGRLSDVARGLDWAVANGADIVNLSLAGNATTSQMDAALERAIDAGVVVVAATGNLGEDGNPVMWPAAHPTTVAVGASQSNDRIAPFSGYGDHVTVAAPGVQVLGTHRNSSTPWVNWSGTSAATPITAGALAAAIGAGDLTMTNRDDVQALVGALTSTAEDLGKKGFDPHFGHGLVRVDHLVEAVTSWPDEVVEEPSEGSTDEMEPVSGPEKPDAEDEPKTEDPKEEEPLVEEPKTEEPKDEEPKDEEPKDEEPKTEEPVVEEPETEEPKLAPFTDVPQANAHRPNIETIRSAGVTQGCGDNVYCPSGSVTRSQMATFLARALGLELLPYEGRFSDVPSSNGHARAIEALARAEVTGGCGGDRYCPGTDVRRDQMASFLTRAYELPIPRSTDVFSDVPGGPHAANVAAVEAAAITGGCGGDRYCPGADVRRDQMASFLARAMER